MGLKVNHQHRNQDSEVSNAVSNLQKLIYFTSENTTKARRKLSQLERLLLLQHEECQLQLKLSKVMPSQAWAYLSMFYQSVVYVFEIQQPT